MKTPEPPLHTGLVFFCVFVYYVVVVWLSVPCNWLPGKALLNYLLCVVEWDVKLYSLTAITFRQARGYLPMFPTAEYHRLLVSSKLYCLVTWAHVCEQLDQSHYVKVERLWVKQLHSVPMRGLRYYCSLLRKLSLTLQGKVCSGPDIQELRDVGSQCVIQGRDPITRWSFPREAFPRDVACICDLRAETYHCASSHGNASRGKDRRVPHARLRGLVQCSGVDWLNWLCK